MKQFSMLLIFIMILGCDTTKKVPISNKRIYAEPKYKSLEGDDLLMINRFENCDSMLAFSKQLIKPVGRIDTFDLEFLTKEAYTNVSIPGFSKKTSHDIEHPFLINPKCFEQMSSKGVYSFFCSKEADIDNLLKRETALAKRGEGLYFGVIFLNLNFTYTAYIEDGIVKESIITQSFLSH